MLVVECMREHLILQSNSSTFGYVSITPKMDRGTIFILYVTVLFSSCLKILHEYSLIENNFSVSLMFFFNLNFLKGFCLALDCCYMAYSIYDFGG